MAYQRPGWADALKNVLSALANQQPAPLLPMVTIMGGAAVSGADLADYLPNAAENDPTLTQMRMALAGWDADEGLKFLDSGGKPAGDLPDVPTVGRPTDGRLNVAARGQIHLP